MGDLRVGAAQDAAAQPILNRPTGQLRGADWFRTSGNSGLSEFCLVKTGIKQHFPCLPAS